MSKLPGGKSTLHVTVFCQIPTGSMTYGTSLSRTLSLTPKKRIGGSLRDIANRCLYLSTCFSDHRCKIHTSLHKLWKTISESEVRFLPYWKMYVRGVANRTSRGAVTLTYFFVLPIFLNLRHITKICSSQRSAAEHFI